MAPCTDSPLRDLRRAATLALAFVTAAVASAQAVPWHTQIAASDDAQTLPQDRGADGLAQTLRKLDTWGSLMMIVAHPDDEDGGMLTSESRGQGVRTAMLTLNRGEGGQNAMSSESYDALGLIRTNELLLADEYSGTEQFFSRVADYGFSKTREEALQQWQHDRVLCDVVREVRIQRPLVLTSVFTGNVTDGHGQHQVAGEMAQEVFTAAADPHVCPEQLAAGLRPWHPLRVFERVPFFAASRQGIFDYATNKWSPVRFYDYVTKKWSPGFPSSDLEIQEGTRDPILGESYLQMARTGWSEQKSQNGGGTLPLPGPSSVGYHLYGSDIPLGGDQDSFFSGIDVTLPGMASLVHSGDTVFLSRGLRTIQQHVQAALDANLPPHPEKIAPELAEGYKATQQLIDQIGSSSLSQEDKANLVHELQIKLAQFNTALIEALGLEVNVLVMPGGASNTSLPGVPEEASTTATPGSEVSVRVHVTAAGGWSRSPDSLQLARVWLENQDGGSWQTDRVGQPGLEQSTKDAGDIVFRVRIPQTAPLTRPYFTRPSPEQPYYDIRDPRWLNLPFAPYPIAGWAEFRYQSVPIRVGQVVQTVHRVHGIGGVYQPLAIVPQLSVNLPAQAGVTTLGATSIPFSVTIRNPQQQTASGTLHLELPSGWNSEPAQTTFQMAAEASQDFHFTLHTGQLTDKTYEIRAVAQTGDHSFAEGFVTVGYPGVRPYYLYRPASYRLRAVDVKVPSGLRVGYVMGTGDDVPQALTEIGVRTQLLTATDLAQGNLSGFDAIVIGIRAYSSRPDLLAATQRLLDYVRNGGTVLVQYQSAEFPAPYPLSLGRNPEKVVDESDPVSLLEPNSPLFTWPNPVTSADFSGWEEERGHSFLDSWSSQYTALTETHDPGQDPQKGGLLVAHSGKGTWIYMAYAVYRQLPDAVPGAYRLLANLVSVSRATARQ